MQRLPKLTRNCVRPVINPILRNESTVVIGRDQKGTANSRLDANEEGYFWKKHREYLQHIEDQLKSGKNIKVVLEEHKKSMQTLMKENQNRVYQNQTVWTSTEEDESSGDMIKSQENAEEDGSYKPENNAEGIWERTKQKWLEIKNFLWK